MFGTLRRNGFRERQVKYKIAAEMQHRPSSGIGRFFEYPTSLSSTL